MFNPRFLHLMHQQVMFAFDTLHCKAENFDANGNKLNPLISGLGFEILSVPRDGDCLFTAVLLQLDQLLPRVDNKELNDHVQMLDPWAISCSEGCSPVVSGLQCHFLGARVPQLYQVHGECW